MIIFLYGADSYHRQKKEKEIVEQYQKKHSNLALEKFDLEEEEGMAQLKDFLTAQSLFDDLKMAVVRNLFAAEEPAVAKALAGKQKDLIKLIQSQLEVKSIYLVISAGESTKKDFSFLLKKPVIFQEFKNLIGVAWQAFINEEIKKRKIASSGQRIVVDESDCYALINELNKIELSSSSDEGIASSAIAVGTHNDGMNFFGSVQKLARGDLQTKIITLETLLDNEDAAKIFNILAYSVSATDQVKMANYDAAIKLGKIDYPEALLDFII